MTNRGLPGKILVNKPNINKEIVAEAQMLIDEDWKPNNKIIKDKKLREAMENEYARRLRLDILSTYKPAQIKKYLRKKRIKLLDAGDSSYQSTGEKGEEERPERKMGNNYPSITRFIMERTRKNIVAFTKKNVCGVSVNIFLYHYQILYSEKVFAKKAKKKDQKA